MKFVRLFTLAILVLFASLPVSSASVKTLPKHELIDINHASPDQLTSLPGIQDALAAKIVKNRPYANKAQLSSKGVISAATYKRIRNRIIAKQ